MSLGRKFLRTIVAQINLQCRFCHRNTIPPHRNLINTLRLEMRVSVERLNGPCTGDRDERAGRESATIPVEVRPVSGRQGRGRRADAWTPQRPGVKAIWRLPSPRGARRNMRPRESRDRRKSAAPIRYTPPHALARIERLLRNTTRHLTGTDTYTCTTDYEKPSFVSAAFMI